MKEKKLYAALLSRYNDFFFFFCKRKQLQPRSKLENSREHCWSTVQQDHVSTCMTSEGNSFSWQCQDRTAKMKTVVSDVALLDLFHEGNVNIRESNLNRSKMGLPLVSKIPEAPSHSSVPCNSCSYTALEQSYLDW